MAGISFPSGVGERSGAGEKGSQGGSGQHLAWSSECRGVRGLGFAGDGRTTVGILDREGWRVWKGYASGSSSAN